MSAPAPAKKAAKPKKPALHPKTSVMVAAAIAALKDRKGSSLAAIKKYIAANYKVDVVKLSPFIRKALKKAVEGGVLKQVKASYKIGTLPKVKKVKKKKVKKAKKPKKVKKPKAKKVKTPKKAKKPAAKKAKSPKKAAKPKAAKKPAAKKPAAKKPAAKKPAAKKPVKKAAAKKPAKKAAPKKK